MQTMAERNGTVISATLFGALAGAGVLPFPRDAFEAAIRAGGKGAEPSLRGFEAGFLRAQGQPQDVTLGEPEAKAVSVARERTGHAGLDALLDRIESSLPEPARILARAGVERLVDYQDVAYAGEYLDRLGPILALDRQYGGSAKGFALTAQAAKYLAVAMSYDDVIRVADLKTRASRFDRVRREAAVRPDQLLSITEFMHPRTEEVLGTLPRRLGSAIAARPALLAILDRLVNRGRRVRTGTVLWFLALSAVAGLGRWRRGSLRHARETEHVAHWLSVVTATIPHDYRPRRRGSDVPPSREGLLRHPRPWSCRSSIACWRRCHS